MEKRWDSRTDRRWFWHSLYTMANVMSSPTTSKNVTTMSWNPCTPDSTNYYYLLVASGAMTPVWILGLWIDPLVAPEWVSRGLKYHSTLYRSFRGRFLPARRPNQQCQSTEGSQSATEIGFNPTRTTPLCYNMNCSQPPLGYHSLRVPVWQKPNLLNL